ncbi:putative 24-methylenesterol C-methyltransferase [Helianthus anomalus]
MPFEYECFDGAYSIEATCHALKLEGVYSDQEGRFGIYLFIIIIIVVIIVVIVIIIG